MKKIIYIIALALILILPGQYLSTKPERVAQIPNGSKFACLSCHNNMLGNGFTPFGLAIATNFLKNGVVQWNANLAGIDSDKDGYSNGLELLDPQGTWKQGDPDPGVAANAGNPGLASSKPVINDVIEFFANKEIGVSPNPMTNQAEISFDITQGSHVMVDIINLNGQRIALLGEDNASSGHLSFSWNVTDLNGNKVSPGLYLVRVFFDGSMIAKKILVQ